MRTLILFTALTVSRCLAQNITGIVDAASFTADVSPGALATVFGSDLSDGVYSSQHIQTSLGGVQVIIDGYAAPLVYVSPTQINIQIPYEVQPGTATAVVYTSFGQSGQFSFDVFNAAPGIFQDANQDAIAQNADGSVNSQQIPAAPGSVVVVYLTGIGPLDHPISTGQITPGSPLSSAALSYNVTIGGQPAEILFLGLTPGFLGLAQANIVMPGVRDGDYPLVLSISGNTSNAPYIAIAQNGVTGSARVQRKINARPLKK
jgi:uncharacterized protein (TIGR03437 family)